MENAHVIVGGGPVPYAVQRAANPQPTPLKDNYPNLWKDNYPNLWEMMMDACANCPLLPQVLSSSGIVQGESLGYRIFHAQSHSVTENTPSHRTISTTSRTIRPRVNFGCALA